MLKVIQNIKLELHRGLKVNTSDPYSYGSKLKRKMKGALNWTLGSSNLSPRCSSTFIKNQRNLRLVGVASSTALILIIALALLPVSSKPKTAEAASGTSSSTTLTIVKASADLDLTTIASSGTFATSSASEMASFNVKTTNYTGYTLTISAADNAGTLTNTTSTGTFNTISGVLDEKTFDDASYNGKWGYKPSKYNSIENVAFWPSPTTTATTLDVTKVANPTTANNYTIALGARAAYTQPTGTYTKTTILTTTANPANYSVTYTDNTSDASVVNIPDSTPSASTYSTSALSIPISSVTPSRTGYAFVGWCDQAPTNSGTTCSGNTYTAGSDYGINQTTTNIITLYALWSNNSYGITINTATGIDSVSLNGTVCTSSCVVNGLEGGKTYVLTATPSSYYSFNGWSKTNPSSVIADNTSSITTYTVDGSTDTITPSATSGAKTITVNFAAAGSGTVGVSNVVFTETSTGNTAGTVSTSGGTVKLNPGVGYTMTTNFTADYGSKTYALNSTDYGALDSVDNSHARFIPNSDSDNAVITVTSCVKNITGTMQTYTTPINQLCDDATGTLTDNRKDASNNTKNYTVGVVTANNGGASRRLWMTQNLAVGCNSAGTGRSTVSLTSDNSNVSSTWSTSSAGALTDGNSTTVARMQCNATYGAWYNYAAATAGTITGDSNSTAASYSVCPSGWRLPNQSEVAAAASNKSSFRPVSGGRYYSGTLGNTGDGLWWSSYGSYPSTRWYLAYSHSYLYADYDTRTLGLYVRCVRNS